MTPTRRVPERPDPAGSRRPIGLSDSALVRGVGRLPTRVHTKVLSAFVGIAVLALAVGFLGVRVLAQSNDRVARLGALQERANAFGQLESYTRSIRLLLAENPGEGFFRVNSQLLLHGREATEPAIDQAVLRALIRLDPATEVDSLGFVPDPKERAALTRIRGTTEQLSSVMERITKPGAGGAPDQGQQRLRNRANELATRLYQTAGALAVATRIATENEIAESASSYARQRNLFVAVAVGALAVALLLALVLSWSVIGPIQRIDARLARIAEGDFSEHVDVRNRDELGALAANVNRMNDELDRLYRELEAASRHKSEFLASMSHELRTPLNAVIGFSQALRARMFGDLTAKQEEYLDDILDSANHLLSLINDVLDLSKVEAGQVELDVERFSLLDALESGVVMVRERAFEDDVYVSLSADPEVDDVEGDERRIRQVIFNLLSNAVKFTPAGGAVDVNAIRLNGEVRISVTDTGPGIAPEDRDRIFEEFQQTDAGIEQHEGTGLGLALSKRFVELHGGRIWVDCDLGTGSTFVFTLPVR